MRKRTRRDKRRSNEDSFIFTTDLKLNKPYADYHICIEDFISTFGPIEIILYNKNIGFALIQKYDCCPINKLVEAYCLDFIYINENQRGKGHGLWLMKLILNHFQVVIHALDFSLGFFEYIGKDLGLEKMNISWSICHSFISSNLKTNRLTKVNICIGGCGLKFSGYKDVHGLNVLSRLW